MYTLKSIAQRSTMLGAVVALVAATVLPAAAVFADSLNPLTERSLLLSSSAPGFQDTDGSGNSEGTLNANGETYALPGSGPNGKKTGETFSFKVSTDSTQVGKAIKGMTFQYCTGAAGYCQAPGNNTGDADPDDDGDTSDSTRGSDTASTSDFNVNYTSATFGGANSNDFGVYINGVLSPATDWAMATSNVEDTEHSGALTGKNNFVTLTSTTGITPNTGDLIKIVFRASTSNYITNPGSGAFFVKLNTYDSATTANLLPTTDTHILDGGVTVANVMTDSIHITTKVLETMSFSVGTRNRDTVTVDCAPADPATGCEGNGAVHGTCDPIQVFQGNRLQLGNPDAEYSLETGKAWDVNSYWRLSSNSSGGATVYYSGNTLANTVGDEIAPIGPTAAVSTPGTEQFGLGFIDAGADTFDTAFNTLVSAQPTRFHNPSLYYLVPGVNYADGTGTINGGSPTAKFAFEKESNTVPRVIATNTDHVISCDTAKVRYIGNIGADTPAGIYTTKINYLAAPQY